MYYLQSRYYDPLVGRFINADETQSVVDVKICTQNLFVYCQNNPANLRDSGGRLGWDVLNKFALYALYGVLGQFVSDIIENLYARITTNTNGEFQRSSDADYFASAMGYGMCAFDLFNTKLARLLAPFVPLVVKYAVCILTGTAISWKNLLLDLVSALIAGIVAEFLNTKMQKKLKKLRRGSGNSYNVYRKYLNKKINIKIKINKWFCKASFTIVICTTVIQLLVNLLCK